MYLLFNEPEGKGLKQEYPILNSEAGKRVFSEELVSRIQGE